MRHIHTPNQRTQSVHDQLLVRFPSTATERLFEFWGDNFPRHVMVPTPPDYEELVYHRSNNHKITSCRCLENELKIIFDQPITDRYHRSVFTNSLSIKALEFVASSSNSWNRG